MCIKVINFLINIDLEIIEIKVSIDLTEIKKCVHSSFNFLIYNLMGKFISKNPKIIYYWICWGSLYRSSHSDPVCTRYNSNLYKTLIVISLPWKCTLKWRFEESFEWHTLKIFQHWLQDFLCVTDHFETLSIKELIFFLDSRGTNWLAVR